MKNMKKQLSLFLVLALILGTFGNLTFASAAAKESSWSFKTRTGQVIKVGGDINMQKDEYQNFDIYKSGKEIKPTDKTRTITWSSSDDDVIWIDPSNGRARADKFGTMTEDYGEAVITARIENKVTKAVTRRSFNVSVGTKGPDIDYIKLGFKDGTDVSQALKIDTTYMLETLVYDESDKLIPVEEHKLYFAYFCDKAGITVSGASIKPTADGEYTITVGAFASEAEAKSATSAKDALYTAELKNLVVEANKPKITDIRQIDLSTVALTFNKAEYASALISDSSLLTVTYDISGYPYNADFSDLLIDEENPSTVLVSLFTGLNEGITYTFNYKHATPATASITGSGTKPAQIVLQSAQVQIERDYFFEVKVLNDKQVDITNLTSYNCSFESLDPEASQQYILDGDSLYFFMEGQRAVIKATLDLGYDNYGNPIPPLTSIASFTSVPQVKPIIGNCNGFALAAPGTKENSLVYNTSVKTICVGDFDLYSVYATFPYIDEERETHTRYIVNGENPADGARYSYKSINPTVLEVDPSTGLLYPFSKGTTSIYVLDENETVKGTINISVTDERALSSFALTNQSSAKLSVTGNTNGDEYVTVKLNAKDQLGTNVNLKDITFNITITEPADSDFNILFNHELDTETGILKLWEGALLADTVTTKSPVRRFSIKVSAEYKDKTLFQTFNLTVKNVTNVAEADTKQELVISQKNIDMKLNKDSLEEYKSVIQVITTDKNGYFIRRENVQLVSSAAKASTAKDSYSLVVLYKDNDATGYVTLENQNGTVTLNPITSYGNEIVKTENQGTYTVRLYKGNGTKAEPKKIDSITVTDSTPKLTVSVKTKNIADIDYETVKNSLTVKRGDTDISAYVDRVIPMNEKTVGTTYQIPELILYIKVRELNPNWRSDTDYTEVTLTGLNLQFKIPNY